jgi:hypothetical protein
MKVHVQNPAFAIGNDIVNIPLGQQYNSVLVCMLALQIMVHS